MKHLILIILLFTKSSLYASELLKASDIKKEIELSCHNDVPVLLIFMTNEESDVQSTQDDNELYADWSYYLNNGISSIGDKVNIIKTPVNSGRELFDSNKIPSDMYSLVFVPCKKKALYSESAILEPYVYKYIKLYFQNKEIDLMMSELLEIDSTAIKDERVTPKKWV